MGGLGVLIILGLICYWAINASKNNTGLDTVSFKNDAGVIRQVKVGFSWTGFFFAGVPFFFRGIPSYGVAWVFLGIITLGISNLFLCFIINKQTAHYYLEHGYKPIGSGWTIAGKIWGIDAKVIEA